MEINLGVILATIINFLILLYILKYFFFNKIKAVINNRENYINESIKNADEAVKKSKEIKEENEIIIRNVIIESKKITEEEKRKAEKVYDEIIKEAKEEAALIKQRAMVEITRQKEKAEYYLRKQSVEIAIDLAKKILEREISEEVNRELIDEFISQVGN